MPRTWNIGAGDRPPYEQPAYPVEDGAGNNSSEGGEMGGLDPAAPQQPACRR